MFFQVLLGMITECVEPGITTESHQAWPQNKEKSNKELDSYTSPQIKDEYPSATHISFVSPQTKLFQMPMGYSYSLKSGGIDSLFKLVITI